VQAWRLISDISGRPEVAGAGIFLHEEIRQAKLAHADETAWKEAGLLLWLWVFSTATVTLYCPSTLVKTMHFQCKALAFKKASQSDTLLL